MFSHEDVGDPRNFLSGRPSPSALELVAQRMRGTKGDYIPANPADMYVDLAVAKVDIIVERNRAFLISVIEKLMVRHGIETADLNKFVKGSEGQDGSLGAPQYP